MPREDETGDSYTLDGDSVLGTASFRVTGRGPAVEVAEGLHAYEWLNFEAELLTFGMDVAGQLVLDDPPSRYLLDTFTFARPQGDGPAVTAQAVRSIPVDRIVNEALFVFGVKDEAEPEPEQAAEAARAGIRDETALRFAARLYLRTSLVGGATGQAIASWLDCSPATAIRWVAAAKDADLLQVADTRRR